MPMLRGDGPILSVILMIIKKRITAKNITCKQTLKWIILNVIYLTHTHHTGMVSRPCVSICGSQDGAAIEQHTDTAHT